MSIEISRFATLRIRAATIRGGAALAPLLMALTLGSAQPAQAASSTIVVAPTPNPTDCGKYHSAVTNLDQVLSTTKKGIILMCPGAYASAGEIVMSGASQLTIKNAIKSINVPRIVFSNTAESGLAIQNSSNVTIDGLDLDAAGNTHTFYSMLLVSQSNVTVRNTDIVGAVGPFNWGIKFGNTGTKPLKLTLVNDQINNAAQGVNVSGRTVLNVTSSLIDGENLAHGTLDTGIVIETDSTSGLQPTGKITKSTVRDNDVGILLDGGGQMNITGNSFTGNTQASIRIDQSGVEPLMRNNVVSRNDFVLEQGAIGVWVTLSSDPTMFKLLNTTISGNTFKSRLATDPATEAGVLFQSLNGAAPQSLTGTVSNNDMTQLWPGNEIINVNNWAALKLSHNKLSQLPA